MHCIPCSTWYGHETLVGSRTDSKPPPEPETIEVFINSHHMLIVSTDMTSVPDTASCNSDPPEAKRPRMAETGGGDCTPSWEKPSLPNPHLHALDSDFLYHIGFSREELRDIFGDVKVNVVVYSQEKYLRHTCEGGVSMATHPSHA